MPRQSTKRARTIESRKKDLLIVNNNLPPPVIKVPCPPTVTCDDFVHNRPKAKVDIKSPNSFFVYRTELVKQLLIKNHKFKMTQVSKWASIYWRKESNETKMAYKAMAQKIDREFQERRKKIKGYQIVCENHLYSKPEEVKPEESINKESITRQQPIKKDQTPSLGLINWQQQQQQQQQRQQRQQKQHRQQQQQQQQQQQELQRQQQPQQQLQELQELQQPEQSQQSQQLQQQQQQQQPSQPQQQNYPECIDFSAVSPISTSSTYSPICPASPNPFIKDEFSSPEYPSINENIYDYISFENNIDFNDKIFWIPNDNIHSSPNPECYNAPIYVEPHFNEYLQPYY